MPVWWRRKDNFKTMMVVKDGKNMIVAGWWRKEDNKVGLCGRKGRATTEIVLVMIDRRRQHNLDSVLEEKGRQ